MSVHVFAVVKETVDGGKYSHLGEYLGVQRSFCEFSKLIFLRIFSETISNEVSRYPYYLRIDPSAWLHPGAVYFPFFDFLASFLFIGQPQSSQHATGDCLHIMAGGGVLEGWNHYTWNFVTMYANGG